MDIDEINDILADNFDMLTADNIKSWLFGNFPDQVKQEILSRLKKDPASLTDAFYRNLTFGTGGMRGIVGIGTNRINVFNIRKATQVLVNSLITRQIPGNSLRHKVIVGYDTRAQSQAFAWETAAVLSSSGIEVLLFDKPRPVAMVSFGVIREHCSLGIMITASHNPPEYNGYKVYMETGGQVISPFDKKIIEEFNCVKFVDVPKNNPSLIRNLGEDMDKAYLETVDKLRLYGDDDLALGNSLSVIYSSLHGTGMDIVPRLLKDWGFSGLEIVKEQAPDQGLFHTIGSPNPEEKEALLMGIEVLKKNQGDLFLATDPDADRLGVVILDKGEVVIFNGNQIACLLAHHILGALAKNIRLNDNYKLVKTIVTTELLKNIAQKYGADVVDVPTGFKYVGEKMALWEGTETVYVFGAEESYGYLYGTYAKDKDAAAAAALIAEAALQAKNRKKTLLDVLYEIYNEHGFYACKTVSKTFEGKAGDKKIKDLMTVFRQYGEDKKNIGGKKVLLFEDYSTGKFTYAVNVLRFFTEDGCRVVCRPSGTEPKMKFYFELCRKYDKNIADSALSRERMIQVEAELDDFIKQTFSTWNFN